MVVFWHWQTHSMYIESLNMTFTAGGEIAQLSDPKVQGHVKRYINLMDGIVHMDICLS